MTLFNKQSDKAILTQASYNYAWLTSDYAAQYLLCEAQYYPLALRQICGPNVLRVGSLISGTVVKKMDFPLQVNISLPDSVIKSGDTASNYIGDTVWQANEKQVLADAAFLPIEDKTISSLLLPHVLETNTLPHQVLREVSRVLRPEGYLVLTGFNPMSLLGLQKRLYPQAVFAGQYYPLKCVKDWLKLLGFEVVGSAMFQYAPLSKNQKIQRMFAFLESVGDRWLPMLGGGYMIIAKKKKVSMTMVGASKLSKIKRRSRASVVAGNVKLNADNNKT